jgi:hypothetical protein
MRNDPELLGKLSARKPRELPAKKSPQRRESAETKLRVSILKSDVYVESLIRELGQLIEDAQRQVAVTANAALTTLYWQVLS